MNNEIKRKRQLQMMQSAWCESEQCRVTIGLDDLEERIRKLSNERKLTCPNCKATVIVKAGDKKSPHFAHWDDKTRECFDEFYEPDSPEHQGMKLAVKNFLQKAYPDAPFIEIEVPIKKTGQRADVLMITASGQQTAFEVQVSSLSAVEWQTRHDLYRSSGIQDIWLIGASRWQSLLAAHAQEISSNRDLAFASYLPSGYQVRRAVVRRGFSQTVFESRLAEAEGQLYYLDILTNPARPMLILVCRMLHKGAKAKATGFSCSSYDFPFKPPVIQINFNPNPRNLITPYEDEARAAELRAPGTGNNYPTAMSAEDTIASRKTWEAERQSVWENWKLDDDD